MQTIDQKIQNILKDLSAAHSRSEKFYGKQLLPGVPIKPVDFFDMALAFESEDRILVDLDLAFADKFPDHYTNEQIGFLKQERDRLTRRIRAWQNRQLPAREDPSDE